MAIDDHTPQDLIDHAVKVALSHNSKSSVMYLLRERLIREVIESAAPILTAPLRKRIKELEAELESLRGGSSVPVRPKDDGISKIKEAAQDLTGIIEDPLA